MALSHVELAGSRRPPKGGSRRVREIDPHAPVEVTVTIRAPALPEPAAAPAEVLTPGEFADKYGAGEEEVRKVETVLRGFGLAVQGVSSDRRSLRVSGSAAAVEAAFQPGMAIYHSPYQGEFRGREGTLKVPAELDGIITGIFGVDQRQVAHRKTTRARSAADAAAPATGPLTPADLEQRYNFPPGDAAGQTIAIAEFGVALTSGSFLPPAYVPDAAAVRSWSGRPAHRKNRLPRHHFRPECFAPASWAGLRGGGRL